MPIELAKKYTIADLRATRKTGRKMAMLTCYDYTSAVLMQQAGVPALLVGDSAANVILGYDSTLPVSLEFMMTITAGVRRGAPLCLVMADMPFGSYHGSLDRGVENVCKMVKETGCDAVKIEAGASQIPLIRELADAGVAVFAHLGLRPQSVGVLGGYRFQGRTAVEARAIVHQAAEMASAGAAGILLEAVAPEVSAAVVDLLPVPVIGCGAGPACDGFVFVTHDAIGLTPRAPKFVPRLGNVAAPMLEYFADYVQQVIAGKYPAEQHGYDMPPDEKQRFEKMKSAGL